MRVALLALISCCFAAQVEGARLATDSDNHEQLENLPPASYAFAPPSERVPPADDPEKPQAGDGARATGDHAESRRIARGSITPEADAAIRRGLDFLVKRDLHRSGDGSFDREFPVALTALAGMALLGYGAEYKRGPYGANLARAVEYLLDARRRDEHGYFQDGRSKMHGHAYAVLFLAQVAGSVSSDGKDREIRETVQSGVRVIESSQTAEGGWNYDPRRDKGDEGSITVCCLQALRAANDAGFLVDKKVIDRAVDYMRRSANPDGSFRYSLSSGSDRRSYELTAAAVSTLDAAGLYTGEVHSRGVAYMKRRWQENPKKPLLACHFEQYRPYGNFYAAQVYHQLGGETWESWSSLSYPALIEEQDSDGSWKSSYGSSEDGKVFGTVMSVLMLEIPLGYLPIFER
ncbi:MAG: prenyltransferase/squalene oxidase repeat-containing protein [Planctomycetota bacterium]